MNYKNSKILITLLALMFVGGVLVSPAVASAQNLVVNFENDPLFSEANFLPGNEVVRTVIVDNDSPDSQNIIVEAVNVVDGDGLGDVLNLVIKEGESILYDETLGDFLRAGEVSLSSIGSAGSATYSFGVTFVSDADDDTQATDLGFDLCVGFEGGDMNCGGTVVGDEGDTGGGGSGDGGGGGGGGGIIDSPRLQVADEEVKEVDFQIGTALIEWNTNLLSTSRVIYGLSSGSYSINLTVDPNFGYPSSTDEILKKVTEHSVLLTGLIINETYKYRVVSRASPPTVGFEYVFDFIPGGTVAVTDPVNDSVYTPPAEAVAPTPPVENTEVPAEVVNEEATEESKEEIQGEAQPIQNTAAVIDAFPDSFFGWLKCIGLFILILIAIFLLWIVWKIRYKNSQLVDEDIENITKKRYLFFIVTSLISAVGAYLLGYTCVIAPLLLFVIILSIFFARRKFMSKDNQ